MALSRLDDKEGYDDLFWMYPPKFVAQAEKRNICYRCCVSFCLGIRFGRNSHSLPVHVDDRNPLILRHTHSLPALLDRHDLLLSSSNDVKKEIEDIPHTSGENVTQADDVNSAAYDQYIIKDDADNIGVELTDANIYNDDHWDDNKPRLCTPEDIDKKAGDNDDNNTANELTEGTTTDNQEETVNEDANIQIETNDVDSKENADETTDDIENSKNDDAKVTDPVKEESLKLPGIKARFLWRRLSLGVIRDFRKTLEKDVDDITDRNYTKDTSDSEENADEDTKNIGDEDTKNMDDQGTKNMDDERDMLKDDKEDDVQGATNATAMVNDSDGITQAQITNDDNLTMEETGIGAIPKIYDTEDVKKKKKKAKKKDRKKSKEKKRLKKQKSIEEPVQKSPDVDFSDKKIPKKTNKDTEKTEDNEKAQMTIKVKARYAWQRISRSIIRDFRKVHNLEDDGEKDSSKADDVEVSRQETRKETRNDVIDNTDEIGVERIPFWRKTITDMLDSLQDNDTEEEHKNVNLEPSTSERNRSLTEPEIIRALNEEVGASPEASCAEDGAQSSRKNAWSAWDTPLNAFKSQTVYSEMHKPKNVALQEVFKRKRPKLPTINNQVKYAFGGEKEHGTEIDI